MLLKKGQLITEQNREIEVYEYVYKSASIKSFEAYHDTIHNIWHTRANSDDFNSSTCTLKFVRMQAFNWSRTSNESHSNTKRRERKAKKGRPAKSKSALKLQDPVV